MTTQSERLEYLRSQIHAQCISYGELAELEDLKNHIEPGDVELLEWAGVPEFPCSCDASERDPFGNVDRIPNPDCPVHEA